MKIVTVGSWTPPKVPTLPVFELAAAAYPAKYAASWVLKTRARSLSRFFLNVESTSE